MIKTNHAGDRSGGIKSYLLSVWGRPGLLSLQGRILHDLIKRRISHSLVDVEWSDDYAEKRRRMNIWLIIRSTYNEFSFVCREYQTRGSGAIEWEIKYYEDIQFLVVLSYNPSKDLESCWSLSHFAGETLRGRAPWGGGLHCGRHSRGSTRQSSLP